MLSSISRSAIAVSAVMMLLVGLCGGIGYWSATNTEAAIDDLGSVTITVQRHMQSDMMHDAIRADIAAAIASRDPATGIQWRIRSPRWRRTVPASRRPLPKRSKARATRGSRRAQRYRRAAQGLYRQRGKGLNRS